MHIGPVADEQLHGLQVIIETGLMQRRAATLNHARYQTEAGRERDSDCDSDSECSVNMDGREVGDGGLEHPESDCAAKVSQTIM